MTLSITERTQRERDRERKGNREEFPQLEARTMGGLAELNVGFPKLPQRKANGKDMINY